mmetsp:Transcript_156795/g.503181  ORF Transcript_156795/g.503181 Transcript_156795/m.503181 type:complete len:212 (-) Transcript_156795:315-950(-)
MSRVGAHPDVQHLGPVPVALGAHAHEQPSDLLVAKTHGLAQRREAEAIALVEVRARLEEPLHQFDVTVRGGDVQRRSPVVVGRAEIRPPAVQLLDVFRPAGAGGAAEQRGGFDLVCGRRRRAQLQVLEALRDDRGRRHPRELRRRRRRLRLRGHRTCGAEHGLDGAPPRDVGELQGFVQRGVAPAVLAVDVGLGGDQEFDDRHLSVRGRDV